MRQTSEEYHSAEAMADPSNKLCATVVQLCSSMLSTFRLNSCNDDQQNISSRLNKSGAEK